MLFSISHQAPSLQSCLQQQAQLELLARRVSLLEAIIWPGNHMVGRKGLGRAWDTQGASQGRPLSRPVKPLQQLGLSTCTGPGPLHGIK